MHSILAAAAVVSDCRAVRVGAVQPDVMAEMVVTGKMAKTDTAPRILVFGPIFISTRY